MACLLTDSQKKSQALERQSEELAANNQALAEQTEKVLASEEELKAQSEELKAQSEELKAQGEELLIKNNELEEKTRALELQKHDIEEKNSALEESKTLLQTKADELEKSSKYKTEFLSNMSHELRTPLNSLLILSQSFMDNDDGNLTQDQIERASVIYNSGRDLLTLINDILDLSKVEAGKLVVEFNEYEPAKVAKSVCGLLKPVSDKKGIELIIDIDRDIKQFMISDRMRIEQILKNLMSNAVKFSEEGSEIFLKVFKTANGEHSSTRIAFAVQDSGIGISEKDQKAIFESFQQADGSISRRFGGTGLGLTISRQLAGLLGGEINLESQEGQGSTFTLLLPWKEGRDESRFNDSQPILSSEQQTLEVVQHINEQCDSMREGITGISDGKILIIEDDVTFQKIVVENIERRGMKALVSSTGKEGLEQAKTSNPSAIILDVGLPDINGLELLEKLKKDRRTKNIPVHVVSAADIKEKSLQKGAIGFVNKPLDKAKLSDLLDKASELLHEPVKEVLVVEDDDIEGEYLANLIKSDNVNVKLVTSVSQAEKELRETRFHCMILDLNIPGGGGLELLERINKDSKVTVPAVMIYTAQDITEEDEKVLSEYTPTIILKSADSKNRLVDELSLFLHGIDNEDQYSSEISVVNGNQKPDGFKVLLVDDDMRNNIALGSYLRKQNFDVVTADNGELALQRLSDESDINIVLMDIMMPVMDGYTAISEIRKTKSYKDIPIIALTAKSMKEDRDKWVL